MQDSENTDRSSNSAEGSQTASQATKEDHLLAADLATRAGDLLLATRSSMMEAGTEPREIKDEGDRRSHVWLMEQLSVERPLDAVLSEEATADEAKNSTRLDAARVWIIDPVDGTREYGEGREDWAVHVALSVNGKPVCGAVALPAQGVTFSTAMPPMVPEPPETPRVIVSRSRPPAKALTIASELGADLVEMGSAGAKAMAIIQGKADVYPHSGGQYEWDSAAPVAVALSAGLHCSRLDGSEMIYNRPDPYLPDLIICRPEHADAAIAAAGAQ